MQLARFATAFCLGSALIPLGACGSGETLVSISVTPASTAASSSAPNNTVQFTAMGNYAPSYCGGQYAPPCSINQTQALNTATWSTSDSANTSIDPKGLATCLSPTAVAAKIIASAQGASGLVSGKADLTCN